MNFFFRKTPAQFDRFPFRWKLNEPRKCYWNGKLYQQFVITKLNLLQMLYLPPSQCSFSHISRKRTMLLNSSKNRSPYPADMTSAEPLSVMSWVANVLWAPPSFKNRFSAEKESLNWKCKLRTESKERNVNNGQTTLKRKAAVITNNEYIITQIKLRLEVLNKYSFYVQVLILGIFILFFFTFRIFFNYYSRGGVGHF